MQVETDAKGAPEFVLDAIDVKNPCQVSWDSMSGDERARSCLKCRQNVYNLSNMAREEAEDLLRKREGRVCIRFYRRPDGTVMTRDCGRVRVWRARKRMAAGVAVALFMALNVFAVCMGYKKNGVRILSRSEFRILKNSAVYQIAPYKFALDWVENKLYPARSFIMGEIISLPPAPPNRSS